mmetsp:Transcript_32551/g.75850  ORF Transcript_32551/g.75850 Transcript_32551/m.75850 type:complete len:258 (-) Transcript_32551:1814-2587(-)
MPHEAVSDGVGARALGDGVALDRLDEHGREALERLAVDRLGQHVSRLEQGVALDGSDLAVRDVVAHEMVSKRDVLGLVVDARARGDAQSCGAVHEHLGGSESGVEPELPERVAHVHQVLGPIPHRDVLRLSRRLRLDVLQFGEPAHRSAGDEGAGGARRIASVNVPGPIGVGEVDDLVRGDLVAESLDEPRLVRVLEPAVQRTGNVAKNALDSNDMRGAGVGHEAPERCHGLGNVGAGRDSRVEQRTVDLHEELVIR